MGCGSADATTAPAGGAGGGASQGSAGGDDHGGASQDSAGGGDHGGASQGSAGGGDGLGGGAPSSSGAGSDNHGGGASQGSAGGGGGASSSGAGDGSGGGAPGALCAPPPACDAEPPDPGEAIDWNHTLSYLIAAAGEANHRGRDLYLNPDDPQWIIGKFAYGITEKDLKDERVDIYLLRGCGGAWERLGSVYTTEEDGFHPEVEGTSDTGGRVYFEIPAEKRLGVGRHRVHLVARGDLSSADLFIEVVPRGTPMFVSDVDGTLTGTETEEFTSLLLGRLPDVHPDAAAAFHKLVSKGYRPMYLTARPEWLVQRTRDFLDTYGFPPGIVHTTLGLTGATGESAVEFKAGEIELLEAKGLSPAWAFGNTETDAEAYDNGGVPLAGRVFYQFEDEVYGGRRIERYAELLDEIEALPSRCE